MKQGKILLGMCMLFFINCGLIKAQTPFKANGALQLIGTQLCNQYGTPIQLRGMSTHGLQYRGNCYNDASLNVVVNQWGIDILRLSMYVQEGGYESNPAYYTQFVDELVEKCYNLGIYALIDWHMLHPGDPNANTALAKVFFEHVSKKHAKKGNVLYEICNEPNNDNYVVTWPMIKNYADQIVPIIRNNDPNSIIIVGTPEFASRPDFVIGNALNFKNILYTMHFYAADPKQTERMGYVSKAIQNGIPVFVTEFGTQNGWGDGAQDFVTSQRWLDFLAERKISWCCWNYSDSPLSGAAWKTGTCPNGPWTDNNLKESGLWIKSKVNNPADNWGTPQSPYDGSPITIPGIIEAENFDKGGEGIAYHDISATNEGGHYRLTEAVDIEPCTLGGYNLAYNRPGEWLEYTVNVAVSGTYAIAFETAAASATGSIRITINDKDITGNVTFPATGAFQTWKTTIANNILLTAGQQVIRLEIITSSFNLNKITFTKTPSAPSNLTATATSSSQINLSWKDNSDNENFFRIERSADGTTGWTSLATTAANATTYSSTGLAANTTYYYRVKGENAVGSSFYSNTASTKTLTPLNNQTPYGGIACAIPGAVEAENYDLGGQGIAFNDVTPVNEGAAYRTDAVDIEPTNGGGYNVGWIAEGEWLEYTVTVQAGTYKIDARVAAIAAGKNFRLELDGVTLTSFNVPNTGNWQTFQTVSANNINLTAGTKILRVLATSTEFNIDKIVFSKITPAQASFIAEAPAVSVAPNPFIVNTTIHLEVKKAGYAVIKLQNKEGLVLRTLQEGHLGEGNHTFELNAPELQSNIYFLRCETSDGASTYKIIKGQ